jgi:hypothetical protein
VVDVHDPHPGSDHQGDRLGVRGRACDRHQVFRRPRLARLGSKLTAHLSGWDNDTWALAHWFKEA